MKHFGRFLWVLESFESTLRCFESTVEEGQDITAERGRALLVRTTEDAMQTGRAG